MPTLLEELTDRFTTALQSLDEREMKAEVTPSTQERFGHYQCNSAMKLGKTLGKNPREVAAQLVEKITCAPLIESLELAGPGFINIRLNREYLAKKLDYLLSDPRLGVPPLQSPQHIIVEFSSPNVAKQLHVGHIRSTIIGDSLARLFEFLGHRVTRLNHIGDWGTPFGMLIAFLKKGHSDVLARKRKASLTELEQWYKAARLAFDSDPEFKKAAHREVVAMQAKEPSAFDAWQVICEISRSAFEAIYERLGIELEERGESFYEPMLPEVIEKLERKQLVEVSEGARCLFLEGFEARDGKALPLIVQKSDGGYNYATTDLAAMRHRAQDERADRIIVVVDSGQALHLQMVHTAAVKANFIDADRSKFEHVGFGLVLGEDGKKIKTRSGESIKLMDLLDEAVERAERAVRAKDHGLSEEEIGDLAEVLGIDAIKYADLSSHRVKDYTFSFDRMLSFEGNTAAFLLYSYVRAGSIQRKAGFDFEKIKQTSIRLEHDSEVALALHLLRFSEALSAVDAELLPNRLADYLYTLSEKFNAFFRDCQVTDHPLEKSRLLICEGARRILRQGLAILGLKTVEKM